MTSPSKVQVAGPLSPFASGFIEALEQLGYTPLSAVNQLRVMAHLSRWMAAEGVAAGGLSRERTLEFLQVRRGMGYTCWLSERGLAPLLSFLRSIGAIPQVASPVAEGYVDEILDAYRIHLIEERGLVPSTVSARLTAARRFLVSNQTPPQRLTGQGVRAFIVQECSRHKPGTAQFIASQTRSLLRFLFVSGRTANDLSAAVPAVARRRHSSLPKGVERVVVMKLLASCDRRTNIGKRDFALLTLLARMGLRSGEVVALSLDDIDWRSAEIAIVGKGNRMERLPMPVDVGEALVAYLRRRGSSEYRNVFLRSRAPRRPITTAAINAVVWDACARADVSKISPHRLRHSLAIDMLSAGSSLAEIGQVLRHRSANTTAIYAKVDDNALRPLAMPWLGGAL